MCYLLWNSHQSLLASILIVTSSLTPFFPSNNYRLVWGEREKGNSSSIGGFNCYLSSIGRVELRRRRTRFVWRDHQNESNVLIWLRLSFSIKFYQLIQQKGHIFNHVLARAQSESTRSLLKCSNIRLKLVLQNRLLQTKLENKVKLSKRSKFLGSFLAAVVVVCLHCVSSKRWLECR